MKCKNCQKSLLVEANFCNNCGAKVIKERITLKLLLLEFFITIFGIDSKFFLTLRKMITHPQDVIHEYLNGVRKRYINPFAFLAIGAGLSVIVFNYFADDFIAIQNSMNSEQIKNLKETANKDISSLKNLSKDDVKKIEFEQKSAQLQLKLMDGIWDFMLRYYNLLTFVFLFIYALLSKWTFLKPHNFGEHVIMNGYIYGFTTYYTLVAFIFAILIHPSIYVISIVGSIIYYMYAFGKIYKLSIGKNILKLLRFFIGLIFIFILILILGTIVGIIIGSLGLIK
ncbi:DUF3667 domain-containing protein [Polaribacter sp. MSW13]|uniref:DUF3667 domain-containing protein n=1 Tax=Polaribacter marinus TaxID=2916838 RepID=A0A9X2ANQ8_9FLAO|nr:DUF3667 domain-containing protein [Polaribacter marinus]MCI2230174.1 DUF3667 domain-containing protein [Polaribacter marinus]